MFQSGLDLGQVAGTYTDTDTPSRIASERGGFSGLGLLSTQLRRPEDNTSEC